jgi:DNA primase
MRIGDAARAYVVVESELDALLIAQEAGELAGVIALGTAGAKPDAETAAQLAAAAAILVALDFDEAGEKASAWWLAHYRQAVRWPPAAGKDPGEFFRAVDVRAWVLAGLPPAWHVAAPVGPLPGESVVVGGAGLEPAVGAGGVPAAQTAPEARRACARCTAYSHATRCGSWPRRGAWRSSGARAASARTTPGGFRGWCSSMRTAPSTWRATRRG